MKRMKRRYKRIVIRSILLFLLFIAAVVVVFFISHREAPKEAVIMEMEDAVLPVVEAAVDGSYINAMHGYTAEMVDRYMRDTVTPLPENRKLPIRIVCKGDHVEKIRFEVRSLDTTQLVEDTVVDSWKTSDNENGSSIELELPIQNLLENGKEYQLKIVLQTGRFEQVAYYTRIVLSGSLSVGKMIRFIQDFHNKTITAENSSGLAAYLKTNTDTTGSLGKVTLNSTYSQLLWNYLHPIQLDEERIYLTDINNSIGTFRMDSRVSFNGKDERTHLCDVQEIFTIQYTNGYWYVLNYERTVNEDLTEESVQGSQSRICLGIAEDDSIHVMANSTGTCQAVVMDGELWLNRISESGSGSLVRVFSYAQEEADRRADYKEHDIKLVSVEDDGNVSFILYGYMNRGTHEGEVGLLFYNYNSEKNCLEEIFYLPFDRSYSILKEEIGRLTYVNSSGVFYLMLNGTIYAIDFAGREYMMVVENVSDDALVINSNSSVIAWEEKQNQEGVDQIQVFYLESGRQNTVMAEEGEYLHAAGFVGEDLTVGRIRREDCSRYSSETAYPMYALDIIGEDGSVVGRYQKSGILITGTRVVNGSVVLERSRISGTSLQKITDDALIENANQVSAEEELLFVEKSQDEYRQWFMKIPRGENRNGIRKVNQISIGDSSYLKISLSGVAEDGMYFAYSKGRLQEICSNVAEAVNLVYDNIGYVTDSNGNYVMRRGYRGYNLLKIPSVQKAHNQNERRYVCMSAFAAYEGGSYSESFSDMEKKNLTDAQMLQRGMTPIVYDLTGCSLNQIAYYYLGYNHPVYAMTSEGAVLIVGISSENVYIWNPMTEDTDMKSIDEADNMFRQAGNVFISCMDK